MNNRLVDFHYYKFMKLDLEELEKLDETSFEKEEFQAYLDVCYIRKEVIKEMTS